MSINHRWTQKETQFLIDNYPLNGGVWCAKQLNIPYNLIVSKKTLLNLKITKEKKLEIQKENGIKNRHIKPPEKYKVNHLQFTENFTPTSVYFLGLFFADGNISTNHYRHSICLTLIKEDAVNIYNKILLTGKWNINHRQRKNTIDKNTGKIVKRKPSSVIYTSNKYLTSFLLKHNFGPHNYNSACSILEIIPENIHSYFLLGLIDGDGCFYINKNNNSYQFSIAGHYDQDWTFVEKIFNKLNIRYKIIRRLHKRSKSSIIRITNRDGIKKLGEYIYNNLSYLGLQRKKDKYLQIIK